MKPFLLISIATILSLKCYAGPSVEEFLKQVEEERAQELNNNQNSNSELIEGKVITFNTRDQEGCNAARIEFKLDKSVCIYNEQTPFVSVVVARQLNDKEYFEKKIEFSKLSEKEKIAVKSVADFSVMGAGMFGLIYALPESVSKWDKSRGFKALAGQYKDRVKAGPVIDKDDWAVNYIGHPLSGAMYYTMVRHQGFSKMESAMFSFCMSTFFWEYGMEAIAEIPSIQDLILTPLIGSIIGEVFYSWDNAITNNGGKLLGSTKLGKTARVLMNPAGSLAEHINKVAGKSFIKDAELSITNKNFNSYSTPSLNDYSNNRSNSFLGLQLKFKF